MKTVSIIQTLSPKVSCIRKPQNIKLNPKSIKCAFDKLKLASVNNIVMKQDMGKCHYTFYEGDTNIGYAVFEKSSILVAKDGDRPYDWYVSGGKQPSTELYNLKPNLFIDELVINDRVGLTGEYSQRKSGKKYGTMCLQKILEWAKQQGYSSRISLVPGKTYSDIGPHKFYAKIGFEMSPNDVKRVERLEEKYSKEPCLFRRNKNEKINGRWVSKGQEIYLCNPEILENYPLY